MMSKQLKILLPLILIISSALISTQALDTQGQQYTDDSLKRALLTFGVARGLNGVLSVAQGTEIALQPAGVGVTFTPGQILDPLNDMVERFSWVMLMSSASIGIQKTLLSISAWHWFSGATLALIGIALLSLWWPRAEGHPLKNTLIKLALVATVLRLSVPMIAITNEWIYQEFLAPQYEEASLQLQQTTDDIGRVNQQAHSSLPPKAANSSIFDSARHLYDSATQGIDVDAKLEQYKAAAANASEYLINLIVVFLFQTVIFPLLFLAVAYNVVKSLVRSKRWWLSSN